MAFNISFGRVFKTLFSKTALTPTTPAQKPPEEKSEEERIKDLYRKVYRMLQEDDWKKLPIDASDKIANSRRWTNGKITICHGITHLWVDGLYYLFSGERMVSLHDVWERRLEEAKKEQEDESRTLQLKKAEKLFN